MDTFVGSTRQHSTTSPEISSFPEPKQLETMSPIPQNPNPNPIRFPVLKHACQFDGTGNLNRINSTDISEGAGSAFNWYHVQLPKHDRRPSTQAQSLIPLLHPPLSLHDILMLVMDGPFCDNVNGALFFRVNSSGPCSSDYALQMAARVTNNCIITVSSGRYLRLGFRSLRRKSPLSIIPSVEDDDECFDDEVGNDEKVVNDEAVVIDEKLLESLLSMNHSGEAVPNRVASLLVHIVDAHVHQVQGMVTKLEMEWNSVKLLLHRGKRENFDGMKFVRMHHDLLPLVKIVEQGEQVFARVKEICTTKIWFTSEDDVAFGKLVCRFNRLKGELSFLASQLTTEWNGLYSCRAKRMKRKLYYQLFCSMTFLTLSVIRMLMNVGGWPWTGQCDKYCFLNVMLLYFAIVSTGVFCSTLASTWRLRRVLTRRVSITTFNRF